MKKNPWFRFFAQDFITDVIEWDHEMKGLHIELMCKQWINGSITSDGKYPMGINRKTKKIFDKIAHKYFIDSDGKMFNFRLKKEQFETSDYAAKRVESGKMGAAKRWGTHVLPNGVPNGVANGKSMDIHIHNHNKENIQKKSVAKAPSKPIEVRDKEFKELVMNYEGKYSKDLLEAFYNFWSQPNKENTKMGFELKPTWHTGKRLATWATNQSSMRGQIPFAKGPADPYAHLPVYGKPKN